MKATITEKTYYLITRPDTNMSVENHQDRTFVLRGKFTYGYTIFSCATLNGDPYWEITKENICSIADSILEQELAKRSKAETKKRTWFGWFFNK